MFKKIIFWYFCPRGNNYIYVIKIMYSLLILIKRNFFALRSPWKQGWEALSHSPAPSWASHPSKKGLPWATTKLTSSHTQPHIPWSKLKLFLLNFSLNTSWQSNKRSWNKKRRNKRDIFNHFLLENKRKLIREI